MNFLKLFDSRSQNIFDWYQELADNNVKASKKLRDVCRDVKTIEQSVKTIARYEHQSDAICQNIFNEIHRSFITPMDREDIIALTRSLDDVMDLINLSAETISVYNVKKLNKRAEEFAEIIVDSTEVVSRVLLNLSKRKTFSFVGKGVADLNSLETAGDELLKDGLRELFRNPTNPIDVIKWRDIYMSLEEITDKTENIADVLHGLIIKYA